MKGTFLLLGVGRRASGVGRRASGVGRRRLPADAGGGWPGSGCGRGWRGEGEEAEAR